MLTLSGLPSASVALAPGSLYEVETFAYALAGLAPVTVTVGVDPYIVTEPEVSFVCAVEEALPTGSTGAAMLKVRPPLASPLAMVVEAVQNRAGVVVPSTVAL